MCGWSIYLVVFYPWFLGKFKMIGTWNTHETVELQTVVLGSASKLLVLGTTLKKAVSTGTGQHVKLVHKVQNFRWFIEALLWGFPFARILR